MFDPLKQQNPYMAGPGVSCEYIYFTVSEETWKVFSINISSYYEFIEALNS
jgi:hypothetical protein